MNGWQRFKHSFVQCRGPELGRECVDPPLPSLKNAPPEMVSELADEYRFGVTLFHHVCSTCGKRYTNRRLGHWREDES